MRIRVISSLQSMKPFWTMSQMSTLDGSPKLERQVEKLPKSSNPYIYIYVYAHVHICPYMSIYVSKIFQNFTSPQVQKLGLQAAQKTARISAAGYFYITRNTITRVIWKFRYFHIFLFELERYILSFLGVWHEPSLHLPLGQV